MGYGDLGAAVYDAVSPALGWIGKLRDTSGPVLDGGDRSVNSPDRNLGILPAGVCLATGQFATLLPFGSSIARHHLRLGIVVAAVAGVISVRSSGPLFADRGLDPGRASLVDAIALGMSNRAVPALWATVAQLPREPVNFCGGAGLFIGASVSAAAE